MSFLIFTVMHLVVDVGEGGHAGSCVRGRSKRQKENGDGGSAVETPNQQQPKVEVEYKL